MGPTWNFISLHLIVVIVNESNLQFIIEESVFQTNRQSFHAATRGLDFTYALYITYYTWDALQMISISSFIQYYMNFLHMSVCNLDKMSRYIVIGTPLNSLISFSLTLITAFKCSLHFYIYNLLRFTVYQWKPIQSCLNCFWNSCCNVFLNAIKWIKFYEEKLVDVTKGKDCKHIGMSVSWWKTQSS